MQVETIKNWCIEKYITKILLVFKIKNFCWEKNISPQGNSAHS